MKVIFLGTGTSHGIPMIGCDCPVCLSDDPRDKRTRPSILVQFDGYSILIDTTPELRLQCLTCGVSRVDAVLYTHSHADHVVGLDDLRRFNDVAGRAIRCFGTPETINDLKRMFPYAFRYDPDYPSAKPLLEAVEVTGPFELFGRTVIPVPLMHGKMRVLGYRIGDFAYCTDCSDIPSESVALLRDLEVLVLDALRFTPHPTHFNLPQAIEWAERIGARRTFLTHIAHEIKHASVEPTLPEGVSLAYDGLVIEV